MENDEWTLVSKKRKVTKGNQPDNGSNEVCSCIITPVSDDTMFSTLTIKTVVDAIRGVLGPGVYNRCKFIQRNKAILVTVHRVNVDKLLSTVSIEQIQVTIALVPKLSTGVVVGIPFQKDLEVGLALIKNNASNIVRLSKFRNGVLTPANCVKFTISDLPLPVMITVDDINYPIRPFIAPPTQCFNCRKFGHTASNCRGKKIMHKMWRSTRLCHLSNLKVRIQVFKLQRGPQLGIQWLPRKEVRAKGEEGSIIEDRSSQVVRRILKAAHPIVEHKESTKKHPAQRHELESLSARSPPPVQASYAAVTRPPTVIPLIRKVHTDAASQTDISVQQPGVDEVEENELQLQLRPFLDQLWASIQSCKCSDAKEASHLANKLRLIADQLEGARPKRPGQQSASKSTKKARSPSTKGNGTPTSRLEAANPASRPSNSTPGFSTRTPVGRDSRINPKKLKMGKIPPTDRSLRSKSTHQHDG